MKGGTIRDNTANNGGGVYVDSSATLDKTGGTIYGNTNTTHTAGGDNNTAAKGNTNGHAVYFAKDSGYYRDATLGTGDNINTSTLPGSGTGQNWTKK